MTLNFLIKLIFLTVVAGNPLSADIIVQDAPSDAQIDSLIIKNWINDKTLLINFGPDALTAIKTQKGIVIIDAGISTYLTTKYRKTIENEFNRKDFAYVINTHGHPDHYRGNSVFPEAQVIGQQNELQEIDDQWKEPDKAAERLEAIADEYESGMQDCTFVLADGNENFIQYWRYYYAWKDAENSLPVRPPNLTFDDSLSLDMGDMRFEMKYFGKCHSSSDILVFIPELKLLFTGDLFSGYGRPSINDGLVGTDHGQWQGSTAWIGDRLDRIDTVIGGHGQILGREDLESFLVLLYK